MKKIDELMNSIERNTALATEPTDYELLRQAEDAEGYIAPKALSDKYNRLPLAKLFPPRRSLLSR